MQRMSRVEVCLGPIRDDHEPVSIRSVIAFLFPRKVPIGAPGSGSFVCCRNSVFAPNTLWSVQVTSRSYLSINDASTAGADHNSRNRPNDVPRFTFAPVLLYLL